MPKRTDIKSILVLGSGPIVIGQACEFDYSGAQACKALLEEGYRVVLLNSNPATIMTDPGLSDACYIEPLTLEAATRVIEKEKPDAVLPTVGGQTALNLAVELAESGVLAKHGVEMIGADLDAIQKAEARERFKQTMDETGLPMPRGGFAHSLAEAEEIIGEIGFPAIIRPSFTLGGSGSGMAYNIEEFREMARRGLSLSATTEILVEESVLGWKEFELEVIRDGTGNVIIICSIENIDPMGVHTGDSVTVAPAMTLSDVEYQQMRDWAKRVVGAIGVETGGSNVQFAVNPEDGRMLVIEMNPRVSRSSALASKATGFPIARIAAKLAVGYTLDELPNDITQTTPASFEPALDYVVVKIPRWEFERFPNERPLLGSQMKSIGEAMAIGRTFKQALQKGFASMEDGRSGLGDITPDEFDLQKLRGQLSQPNPLRFHIIHAALKNGWNVIDLQRLTLIDPWFILQIQELVEFEQSLEKESLENISEAMLNKAKRLGLSDRRIAKLLSVSEADVRRRREALALHPVFKMVDTCAAEFQPRTPYMYSTYEMENESVPESREKVIILGGGPNRIGQAIEFDYCCCQASYALREMDIESIMINCNPETVSTDFDTSDRLYFEPLTLESVLEICRLEKPDGVVIQFGGQTPLKLARDLQKAGVPILGTQPEGIDLAEDRQRFSSLMKSLNIRVPRWAVVGSEQDARGKAAEIGYPVLIRPSYVLGGAAMRIVYHERELIHYLRRAVDVSPDHPVFIDRFLEDAFEVDVDAISDGRTTVIAGILQHIEEAGVHSGDSAMMLPTFRISQDHLEQIRRITPRIAEALSVAGLLNIQFAIQDETIYVIEANPRASRTIPFISKATGVPFVKKAMRVAFGSSLADAGLTGETVPEMVHVKASVFPFNSFPSEDPVLGPQMRSTGEVMGRGHTFGEAFLKAMSAAGMELPTSGAVFISVNDGDKAHIAPIARGFSRMGFTLYATRGTASVLEEQGIEVELLRKIASGRPNVLDAIKNNDVNLIINTPLGAASHDDDSFIRIEALRHGIPCLTTLSAAEAALQGIAARQQGALQVEAL